MLSIRSYLMRFEGRWGLEPALSPWQVAVLRALSRRAPVAVEGAQFVMLVAQNHEAPRPPSLEGQPPGDCCWCPTTGGAALEWDGCETFRAPAEWGAFLTERFLVPWGVALTGSIRWVGEDGAEGLLVANGRGVTFEDAEGSITDQVSVWLDVAEGDEPAGHAVATRALVCAGEAAPALQARVVDVLLRHLAGAHRNLVIEALGALGPVAVAAVPALVALLAHENPQTRYWATFALGRIGRLASVAVPGLERLVGDPEYGPLDALKRIAADRTNVGG